MPIVWFLKLLVANVFSLLRLFVHKNNINMFLTRMSFFVLIFILTNNNRVLLLFRSQSSNHSIRHVDAQWQPDTLIQTPTKVRTVLWIIWRFVPSNYSHFPGWLIFFDGLKVEQNSLSILKYVLIANFQLHLLPITCALSYIYAVCFKRSDLQII